jgi:hypothetical protein
MALTKMKNKDKILGLLLSPHTNKPLAISIDYLYKNPLYHGQIEDLEFVALTDKSGAVRVYEAKKTQFVKWDQDRTVGDRKNTPWHLTESRLQASDGRVLHRLPAHRSFWFGWYSAYTHTKLIK